MLENVGASVDWKKIEQIYEKYNLPENVRHHIEAVTLGVARVVEKLQKRDVTVDVNSLILGALLHDIGRSVTHDISHGVIGSAIAREEGFSERVCLLIERHVGAGLTLEEARSFGLPERSYMPETLEEKILAAVDNLASGDELITKEEFIRDVELKFDNGEVARRFFALYEEDFFGIAYQIKLGNALFCCHFYCFNDFHVVGLGHCDFHGFAFFTDSNSSSKFFNGLTS